MYRIPDVSAEAVAEAIEGLCESVSLTDEELSIYINKSLTYARRVIIAAEQLGLAIIEDKIIKKTANSLDLGKATKNQRPQIFQKSLIMFAPFVLFAKLIMKGENVDDSARKVKVIFKIPDSINIIRNTLRSWGTYTGLLIKDGDSYKLKFLEQEINEKYLKELIEASYDEFKAQLFIASKLDDYAYSYLNYDEKEGFIKALQKYRFEPEDAAKDASNSFESFLFRIGMDNNLDTSRFNGIEVIANALKGSDIILEQHRKICSYHSALRNAANHGIDRVIGKQWSIESDASLELILSELTAIRSILRFINNNEIII